MTRNACAALLCLAAFSPALAQTRAPAAAQPAASPAVSESEAPPRTVAQWLARLQRASRVPAYSGTFVVSAPEGVLSSARIWHACQGAQEIERVENLSGPPRATYRRDDDILIFQPGQRTIRAERRESGSLFKGQLRPGEEAEVARYYDARPEGQGRVAGFDADIVRLAAQDGWRYGYRIWSERRTGLVIKMQTLDAAGRVLEQSAFSELQFSSPLEADKLAQMMDDTQGWHIEKAGHAPTRADSEGWTLASPVPGFRPRQCYQHGGASNASGAGGVVQWIFSDGLATVSLFLEPYDARRHTRDDLLAMGATHSLMLRLPAPASGWWLTAVGEVPPQTLQAFAQALRRMDAKAGE